jgi:uncharacterized protein
MAAIIDRRSNQGQKNLGNRQRFIRRSIKHIKDAVKRRIQERSITDTDSGEIVNVPQHSIDEPSFGHDPNSGIRDRVLPGNQDFVPGDRVDREGSGGGRGKRARQGSNSDETFEDDFVFSLTKDEFYNILFEDLELPDLIKKQLKTTNTTVLRRNGIATAGNPSNLNVVRSMTSSLARRLALRRPKERVADQLEQELAELDPDSEESAALQAEIESLRKRASSIPWVDPVDLRYNVFNPKPAPTTSAVMICVMDVSGSMDQHKKDIAKRFFMLLYLFLQRKYENVTVLFVRHHTSAELVTEEQFFYDPISGGTMVSSALELIKTNLLKNYSSADHNIYVCQASDGDNYDSDNETCRELLMKDLLPVVQFFAYIEIGDPRDVEEYPLLRFAASKLFNVYQTVSHQIPNLKVNRVWQASDIYGVFRELFEKK